MLQHVQADAQSSSSTLYGSQFSVEDSPAPHSDELMYREGRARGIQGKGWPSGGPAGLPPVHQQGAVVLVLLSLRKSHQVVPCGLKLAIEIRNSETLPFNPRITSVPHQVLYTALLYPNQRRGTEAHTGNPSTQEAEAQGM